MKHHFYINYVVLFFVSFLFQNTLAEDNQKINNFPAVINSMFPNNTFSPNYCLFLVNNTLSLIDLHNVEVRMFDSGRNFFLCPENKLNVAIDDINTKYPATLEFKDSYIELNYIYNNQNNTYKIICGSNSIMREDMIITNKACGYGYNIKLFFFEYNVIASAILIFVVFIILFGFNYQKITITVSLGYMVFVLIGMLFGFFGNNPLSGPGTLYYVGLLVIVMVLCPLLGFIINMSKLVTKIYFGMHCGFILMKYYFTYLLIFRFDNYLAKNVIAILICYALFTILGGILVCVTNKNDTLIIIITSSFIGAYLLIECLDHFVGGIPREMYIMNLAKYGDFKTINKYLNGGMVYFYLGLLIVISIIGIFHQKWKNNQYNEILKETQKKPKRDVSVQHRSYQLMNKSQD